MAYASPIPPPSLRPVRKSAVTRFLPILCLLYLGAGWLELSVLWGQEVGLPKEEDAAEKGIVRINVGGVVTRDLVVLMAGDSLFLPVLESSVLFGLTVRASEAGGDLLLAEGQPLLAVDTARVNRYVDGHALPVPPEALRRNDGISYLEWQFFFSVLGVTAAYDPDQLYLRLAPGANLPVIKWGRERSIGAIRHLTAREEIADRDAPYYRSLFGSPECSWYLNHQAVRSDGGRVGNRMSGRMHITGALLMGQMEAGIAASANNGIVNNGLQWDLTHWRWAYSNPSSSFLSLLRIGHLVAADRSVLGLSLSNQPLVPRRTHGVFLYSGSAAPGTQVLLTRSDMTTASAVADADGIYQLQVPVGYGTTPVRIRYYSPEGSIGERMLSWTSAPEIIPAGKIDYSMNIGVAQSGEKEAAADLALRAGISSRWMLSGSVSGLLPFGDSVGEARFARILGGVHGWIGRSSSLFAGINPHAGTVRARLDLGGPGESGLTLMVDSIGFDGRSDVSAGGRIPLGPVRLAARLRFLHDVDSVWRVAPYGSFGVGLGNTSINLSAYALNDYREWDRSLGELVARLDVATYPLSWLPVTAGFRWFPERQTVSDLYLGATAHWRNGRRIGIGAFFPTASLERAYCTLRLELPIANVRPVMTATAGAAYSSLSTSLEGTAAITPLGVEMLPIGYRGRFSILLTGFDDRNRNGKRDAGERDLGPVEADVRYEGRTQKSVEGVVEGLPPYRKVRVEIDRFGLIRLGLFPTRSVLLLTTAPGSIQQVEIPFAEGRDVTGAISVITSGGLPDPGAFTLLTALEVFLADANGGTFQGEVFSDGTLYFPGVAEGIYSLHFDRRQLEARGLCIADLPEDIDISGHESDMLHVTLRRCE